MFSEPRMEHKVFTVQRCNAWSDVRECTRVEWKNRSGDWVLGRQSGVWGVHVSTGCGVRVRVRVRGDFFKP